MKVFGGLKEHCARQDPPYVGDSDDMARLADVRCRQGGYGRGGTSPRPRGTEVNARGSATRPPSARTPGPRARRVILTNDPTGGVKDASAHLRRASGHRSVRRPNGGKFGVEALQGEHGQPSTDVPAARQDAVLPHLSCEARCFLPPAGSGPPGVFFDETRDRPSKFHKAKVILWLMAGGGSIRKAGRPGPAMPSPGGLTAPLSRAVSSPKVRVSRPAEDRIPAEAAGLPREDEILGPS